MRAYRQMYHTDVVLARFVLIHCTQPASALPNCEISVGIARIDEAKIGGMTPLMLILSGR